VIVRNSSSLNPGSRTITITAHVKFSSRPSASVGDYDRVRKGSGIYKMEIWDTGQGFCRFQGSSGSLSVGARPDLSDGRWHTIVCKEAVVGHHADRRRVVDVSKRERRIDLERCITHPGRQAHASGDRYKDIMDEVRISIV
jgi:hypothetical protein